MSISYSSENAERIVLPIGPRREYSRRVGGSTTIAVAPRQIPPSGFRRFVVGRLDRLEHGHITLIEDGTVREFGEHANPDRECSQPEKHATAMKRASSRSATQNRLPYSAATLVVRHPRFYRRVALQGALGAAASYIDGDFDTPDLTGLMRLLARNARFLKRIDSGAARLLRPIRAAWHRWNRNSRAGSKKNISAHYDLSNEFFGLMLDPSMTYSSGIFTDRVQSLDQASNEKYDRICRKLRLQPTDHVLEIGTGWGGFAEYAARHYGCRVTTTTISDNQFTYAAKRFQNAGLENRIDLVKQDYRDLKGSYDKLVSIEMIEAVGQEYLTDYFETCSRLLTDDGMMCLQAITIPDHRFERYRSSVDFIQRYIFPGGFLPSLGAIGRCVAHATDLRLVHAEDFGTHYATTLALWRQNFWRRIKEVKALGFDESFIRTWHYYLCYCEAGFHERQIGVAQITFSKPNCRREPLLSVE